MAALVLAAGAGSVVTGPGAAADPLAGSATQQVSYLGLHFTVPASWPVRTLDSTTCVRYDRHAVYLGVPGQEQHCPAGLSGRTEALVVSPAPAGPHAIASTDHTTAHEISVSTATVSITATYGTDRAAIAAVLASAGLPAPRQQAAPKPNTARPNATRAALPTSVTNGSGTGFDACSAPSSSDLSAWRGTYANLGIYIGGQDRACAQPNLTAGWMSTEAAAGWHFIPIYVGPQATSGQLNTTASATAQGIAAADDAVNQAAGLGLGVGNVLYYDMEAYPSAQSGAALAFISAWNGELHRAGYWSGLYSSANSGIADLVANYGGSSTPDVAFTARWNNVANTDDANIPATEWANHQRVHQYAGGHNETYNGVTINVDSDFLDVGTAGPAATPVTGKYVPTGPTRLLDTRSGSAPAPVGANQSISLQITGVASIPTSVTAVVLNVTVTNPTAGSFLTVYPDGPRLPTASNLNFSAGQTIANLVTVPVTDGKVNLYNLNGTVDVIADLFGYYTTGSGNTFTPAGPTRLLDTRSGSNPAPLGPQQTLKLPVAGMPGVPTNASAVVLNVTVTNPTQGSFLTVYPDGEQRPVASNLNFGPGQALANLVIVPVVNGTVDFYNLSGSVDVIADLFGYFTSGSGSSFTPTGPTRLLDTRNGPGPLGANQSTSLQIAGNGGIPGNVTAVVLNVTVTNPTASSFLTVYPDGLSGPPTASNLNFTAGETVPNLVTVPVTDGKVDMYNLGGTVDVIADVFGYYTN
ncbi:MAG TPA: DUF1906 domain-containing protein [Pseudonocardiaceae bacterium]